MQTVKINIRNERSRYIALMGAMMTGQRIEGGYIMEYSEYREQGDRYAKFQLRLPEPAYEGGID